METVTVTGSKCDGYSAGSIDWIVCRDGGYTFPNWGHGYGSTGGGGPNTGGGSSDAGEWDGPPPRMDRYLSANDKTKISFKICFGCYCWDIYCTSRGGFAK